jgi:hypothetical protein
MESYRLQKSEMPKRKDSQRMAEGQFPVRRLFVSRLVLRQVRLCQLNRRLTLLRSPVSPKPSKYPADLFAGQGRPGIARLHPLDVSSRRRLAGGRNGARGLPAYSINQAAAAFATMMRAARKGIHRHASKKFLPHFGGRCRHIGSLPIEQPFASRPCSLVISAGTRGQV